MDKETFFIGNTNITIENPASYYPKTNKQEDIKLFLNKSSEMYQNLFRDLADVSLEFYKLEKSYSSIETQKAKVILYLKETSINKIVADTGISRTTISDLKSGKRKIENTSLKCFETLYKHSNRKY